MRCFWIIRPTRCGPKWTLCRRIWPLRVMKILAEQPKLPQLVGNIFPNVRDRAVGTHNDFRLRLGFFAVLLPISRPLAPRHNPAACVLAVEPGDGKWGGER